jgi:hypothetical protein
MDVDPHPYEWRRVFSPVGAIWLVAVVYGGVVVHGNNPPTDTAGWVRAGVALVLAWAAVGVVALWGARLVEAVWLGSWGWLGGPFTAWRRHRWRAAHAAAVKGSPGKAIRRTAIALAEPERPLWIGDRWASMVVRVGNEYELDVAMTWPRLWLVAPDAVRAELRVAAGSWYGTTVWASWAVLYLLGGIVFWPAAIAGIVMLVWAGRRARAAIAWRADLVESAYDLYGCALAEQLGVPEATRPLRPATGAAATAAVRKGA